MKIVLFTLPGTPPLLGNVIKEEDSYIFIEHPLAVMKETPNVYTFQFMPFAKDGFVMFNVNTITSMALVDEEMIDHYKSMVEIYKKQKIFYKIADDEQVLEPLDKPDMPLPSKKNKVLH